MKLFKSSLIALALASASSVYAESIAITNATVHTVTEQGTLTNATVVMDNGVITAINPKTVTADSTIDAQGKILTPGLIGSMNTLGLVEVSAVSRTRDASDKKADITFDASTAFNPKSAAIAYSRKGGITSNIVTPRGGESMFKGQAFIADLSGEFDSIVETNSAVLLNVGSKSKGSRALALQNLRNKLEDAKSALAKAKSEAKADKKKDAKEPKRDEKIINALLAGEKPLIAKADRATDILALIKLKQEFGLDLVIADAGDAVSVAKQIAEAKVPVIIATIDNLPSFDALHQSLKSATVLMDAGVTVAFKVNGDTHNLYQLRYDAGVAIANGVSKEQALAAVTANVADAFNYDAGRIAVGKKADLVLWSADPFELSSRVEKMWIDGVEHDTQSRQDALRDRYITESDMPRAYTK
ncbi:amidohydrolase family protein [Thalassotalea castellviae]|uniref:Amidohydrolase family protein n=1 Tax=Thalassotalea castellviae TaxID=3075612 RepID=A0ABU2ZYJ1_9GAMM|nr:amidohydrolase family protein [Thalassotalea sp. W431]MDT0602979.1 amidohydrolase family protein [Thalassotalea sp. W431]